MKKKKFGPKEYPMWKQIPAIHPDVWVKEMSTAPYPSKGAWIQGTNTFTGSFGDPKKVYDIFKRLDFVVVLDLFINPTISAFADIVLPIAMFPERNGIKSMGWDRLQSLNKAVQEFVI